MPSDDGSRSSIAWNPNWDDSEDDSSNSNHKIAHLDVDVQSPSNPHANVKSSSMPPSCIDVALTPPLCIKMETGSSHHDDHDGSNTSPRVDDDSSDSSSDDPSHFHQPLDSEPKRPTRYQLLGAPTLLYRHIPSYTDPAQRPSALTPHQIDMATYIKDHPVGNWFQRDNHNNNHNNNNKHRTAADKGETYPHSIMRYMPTQGQNLDAARLVDRLHCANRARVRHFWANTHVDDCGLEATSKTQHPLPMQYTNSLQGKTRYLPSLLEEERLKWLAWKLARWERKDQERWMRKQLLQDYYMERELKRLILCWEEEERCDHEDADDDEVKKKRQYRNKKRLNPDRDAPHDSSEQDLSPLSSCLSSSSVSELSTASTWSSSTSSLSTYYSDESAFQRWEENAVLELEGISVRMPNDSFEEKQSICETDVKRMKLLSTWVFDNNTGGVVGEKNDSDIGGQNAARNQVDEQTSVSDEYHYSLDELAKIIEKWKQSKESSTLKSHPSAAAERLNADVEYFAPFRRQDVREERTQQFEHIDVGGVCSYGNCIDVIKCTCQFCRCQSNSGASDPPKSSKGTPSPSFFLLYPNGDLMSRVMISKLYLPRCNADSVEKSAGVDVGGRILQISICGKSVRTHRELCLVVRTSAHCSILIARPKVSKRGVPGKIQCPGAFELIERARIDLRSPLQSKPSYFPYHVACDPKTYMSFFTRPSFVILCLDQDGNKRNIFHVTVNEKPQVERHDLSSTIADISIIEYDRRDRHALWAAARPAIMPAVSERFFKRGGASRGAIVEGLAGYGHSLYHINLRNDTADFVWSPSHEEFIVDGVYSINGILSDRSRDHILWISSTSAGKIWALDVRYKSPKVLVCWSLPSMCDDLGACYNINGVHGAGVLMNQPLFTSASSDSMPTMFSLKKDTNTSSLNVYQFPSSMPRFHTRPLESAGFVEVPKSSYNITSIARSYTFALPDTSDGIFNVGLATLELSSLTALSVKKLERLGYRSVPAHVAYVFTMNSIGDIYCHTLLACDASEEQRAIYFPGLPVGTTSIPVSNRARRNKRKLEQRDCAMVIELSNNYPIPFSALTSHTISDIQPLDISAIKDAFRNKEVTETNGSAFHKHNPVAYSESSGPCSFNSLIHPEQLTKRDFDVLILSPSEELKLDLNASINQDGLKRKFEISHNAAGFGLLAPHAIKSSRNLRIGCGHLLVAVQNDIEKPKEEPSRQKNIDKKVGDFSQDMIKRLEYRYLRPDFNEESTTPFGVKEESSSSDAESDSNDGLQESVN